MAHLYKLSEWEICGSWYCGDVEELGKGSNYWWLPARMLGMTPADYIKWVIDNFKPDNVRHSEDCSYVGWSWKSQTEVRKFKNQMNALARKHSFMVC